MAVIIINDEETQFDIQENEIIYMALERQEKILPVGCLAGGCGVCTVEIQKGLEYLEPPDVIEQNTLDDIGGNFPGKNLRLICRARLKQSISPQSKIHLVQLRN